jgi:hypothetical protein
MEDCHFPTTKKIPSVQIKSQNYVADFFYQYSETNVMHFLFNLLRIKGLYMFRALLAHPQEALHKPNLVYCVRVMSVGCTRIGDKVPGPQRIGSWKGPNILSGRFGEEINPMSEQIIVPQCYCYLAWSQ